MSNLWRAQGITSDQPVAAKLLQRSHIRMLRELLGTTEYTRMRVEKLSRRKKITNDKKTNRSVKKFIRVNTLLNTKLRNLKRKSCK